MTLLERIARCRVCDARIVPAFDDARRGLCSACVRANVTPQSAPWVRRAMAGTLPPKVYGR